MSFDHRVFYQDVVCQGSAFYRRSDGLTPDRGHVEIDIEDIGEMGIVAEDTVWRSASGQGFPQTSIVGWNEIRGRRTVSTRGFRPAKKRPKVGLNNFGDLVFQTWANGKKLPEVRYSDIFVDNTGSVRDITPELRSRRLHKEGLIYIPLTDIRAMYPGRTPFVGEINARLPNGEYNFDTINPKTRQPWNVRQVLLYMFSQLPGSPLVDRAGEWNDAGALEAAPYLVGKGEPMVEALQYLLDQLGLKAQLQPNGDYTLSSKFSKRVGRNKYAPSVGKLEDVPTEIAEETKDLRVTNRPSCVQVFGGPVIQRSTHPYIAVFTIDGNIYKLRDIGKVVPNYDIIKVNAQVLSQDAFRDLDDLYVRKQLRSQAYRLYAPAYLFDLPIVKTSPTGASFVSEEELGAFPYLPFVDVPLYKSELAAIRDQLPRDSNPGKADREDVVLSAPVVFAHVVQEGLARDWSDAEMFHKRAVSRGNEWLRSLERQLQDLNERLKRAGRLLSLAQVSTETLDARNFAHKFALLLLQSPHAKEYFGTRVEADMDLDVDLTRALREVGVDIEFSRLAGEKLNKATFHFLVETKAIERSRARVKEQIREQKKNLKETEGSFAQHKKVWEEMGVAYFPLVNYPHHAVHDANLDLKTGLVTFADHACQMIQPFVMDQDVAAVGADGQVMVVAGSEYVPNVPGRTTSVLVTSSGEDPVKLSYAGLCRPSPLNPATESMGDVSLYITELGSAMNAGAVITAAMSKAVGQLAIPKTIEGYSYQIDGFKVAVLDGGVDAVDHFHDGEAVGSTTISVNSPNSRTPGGIPKFKHKMITENYRQRLKIEQG